MSEDGFNHPRPEPVNPEPSYPFVAGGGGYTLPEPLIRSRYLFCVSPLTPVVVVAARGGADDWAAYIAGIQIYSEPQPEFLLRIYREGAKLSESEARGFFPDIALGYRP